MCKDCRVKLSLCPTCRGSFSPYNNNSSLNQVLELFPHMCKFEGCEEIVRPNDDHETWCGFRPTKCKICQWTGYGKDILDHVKLKHSEKVILDEKNECRRFDRCNDKFQNCDTYMPIFAHGQFFWMYSENSTEKMSFAKIFTLVPNGKIDCSYEMKFVLRNSNNVYAVSTFLNGDTVLNLNGNDNKFTLHFSILRNFSYEGKLTYDFYVNKLNQK
ncbi:hypothetical protein J6590_093945 [Homalodisca vitripennis]|nr:hypothetical protein J6590_093945 [Homalodisca vitripennis]